MQVKPDPERLNVFDLFAKYLYLKPNMNFKELWACFRTVLDGYQISLQKFDPLFNLTLLFLFLFSKNLLKVFQLFAAT